ncbi:TspO/MBR family protein [Mycolicibacterium sp. ELW1]|jgi:benzodiazapine receptor|uniref:Tryptophan-rich sensory protein n=1 Tax=Mycolicibacterium aichiense TaxID=1799 RepID=A0AAD1HIZ0_9MYCO|nr:MULTISPECIES: TspO/MBR family protein [Mycobacteriaceae]MCV7018076.1 tryptophan-rich sensory protein [Mycolicibacterium aichiense]QEN15832.1 tryptophan-rich sensory protein [Mycobacterium sp. ELW1]BBX06202.1 tryptophan-rich sensory protein [Mycolicibacterium aichiense]STZ24458.1 tryptophan-rich sensory protein [Mycolicibacterium aichiense]
MGKSIVATSLATAAAAVTGSIASKAGVETWYPRIRKPRYVPPNAVFPVAWTTLYADIAVTSAATIDKLRDNGEDAKARAYIGALGANLVLNAGWSWLFFKSHKLGPSAVAAGALAISSADLARRSAAVDPKLGAALAPYPLWCSFATLMSTDIWRLNR